MFDIGRKEGNVLFNDILNTFYLRLYGVRHMVKDTKIAREEAVAATWATLSDQQQGLFYMHHRQDNTYHSRCYASRGALAGTKNELKKQTKNIIRGSELPKE